MLIIPSDKFRAFLVRDRSAWSLIAVNIVVIVFAVIERWDLSTALVIYWFQSVIIGLFNVPKILFAKNIVVSPALPEKIRIPANIFTAGFFAVHYGFFHYVYYQFLQKSFHAIDPRFVMVIVTLLFINHLFSYIYNFKQDREKDDLKRLMFFPYERIMPMHLTIIFGGFITGVFKNPAAEQVVLVLFLVFKTIADLNMHYLEHAINNKGERHET